jgi:hypothetical protein
MQKGFERVLPSLHGTVLFASTAVNLQNGQFHYDVVHWSVRMLPTIPSRCLRACSTRPTSCL